MKICECGGRLLRKGTDAYGRQRFICGACSRTVSADADGNFSRPLQDSPYIPSSKIRRYVKDVRFEVETSRNQRQTAA